MQQQVAVAVAVSVRVSHRPRQSWVERRSQVTCKPIVFAIAHICHNPEETERRYDQRRLYVFLRK